jgi:hypothetical protein
MDSVLVDLVRRQLQRSKQYIESPWFQSGVHDQPDAGFRCINAQQQVSQDMPEIVLAADCRYNSL